MQKLSEVDRFKKYGEIVLDGFDPVSAGGFTQVPNFILKEPALSSNAKVAYAKLLSYAWDGNRVFPGQETMAKDLGVGKRSIVRAVAELERRGYLEVQRRGLGLTNIYILHHTVKQSDRK